uniref:Uncharacterized protein n=2 Tax=Caenorhabditis japonica TaxID=281687 RepID=A0A8R1HK87_CAEJA
MKMKNSEFRRNIGRENYKIGNFRRNSEEEFSFPRKPGCDCPSGKCQSKEGLTTAYSVEELALRILAKAENVAAEDVALIIHSEEFKNKLGDAEKISALRRFARICPAVARQSCRTVSLETDGGAQRIV